MNEENETVNNNPRTERRRKRQREASSQTDEEVDYDSDQNGGPHGSLRWRDEITQKIDKLLDILPLFEDLKEELKTLKEENDRLRKSLKKTDSEMKTLKATQENMATDLHNIKDQLTKANLDLESQKRRNIKLEAQSRRSNIKFFNVPESETDGSPKETEKVVKRLLQNELKMSKDRSTIWNLNEYTAFLHGKKQIRQTNPQANLDLLLLNCLSSKIKDAFLSMSRTSTQTSRLALRMIFQRKLKT